MNKSLQDTQWFRYLDEKIEAGHQFAMRPNRLCLCGYNKHPNRKRRHEWEPVRDSMVGRTPRECNEGRDPNLWSLDFRRPRLEGDDPSKEITFKELTDEHMIFCGWVRDEKRGWKYKGEKK